MPEAKGDSRSMKKTTPIQPENQVTPPAQPAEGLQPVHEEETAAVPATSAEALRARVLGALRSTKTTIAGAQDRQAAKLRAEEDRQRQEERARKMGEFGDLKTQKRDAEERLQPISQAHAGAVKTLEVAQLELKAKKDILAEVNEQMRRILVPEEGVRDEEVSDAMAQLEETIAILQSSIKNDEGTVVPTAQERVDALYAEKVEDERELAEIDKDLGDSRFEGLETEYEEAFTQYQALEAKVDDLAGKYAELDEKLKIFALDAKDKSKTAGGYQHCAELETAFEALDGEESALEELIEAQIIPNADQLHISPPQLEAIAKTCHGFKIGAVVGEKDAFERAADLLGSVSRARASLETAKMNLFKLQVEAFQRKNGVETGGMYPKNLLRIERIRKGKNPEFLGYGFSEPNPSGRGEIIGDDHLLLPGLELKDIRGKDIDFVSVREEQEKRSREATSRRSRPYRRRTGEQTTTYVEKQQEAPAEPGSLRAMHRALMVPVREGQETLAEKIAGNCDRRITGDIKMEKIAGAEGEKEARKYSCPGWFTIMKDSFALGVVKVEEKEAGKFTLVEVVTEPEYQQAVKTLVQTMIAKGEIQTGGEKKPLAEGLILIGQNRLEKLFVEPGSRKAMYIALKAPKREGQETLTEKIAKNCDSRITKDIKEDPATRKYSCPGWFAITKDSFALGVVKVEEKEAGKFTLVEVVTDPEYQQAVKTLVQTMIAKGEIQTGGEKKPLAEGLIPIGQNRLKKLAHPKEKKPE